MAVATDTSRHQMSIFTIFFFFIIFVRPLQTSLPPTSSRSTSTPEFVGPVILQLSLPPTSSRSTSLSLLHRLQLSLLEFDWTVAMRRPATTEEGRRSLTASLRRLMTVGIWRQLSCCILATTEAEPLSSASPFHFSFMK